MRLSLVNDDGCHSPQQIEWCPMTHDHDAIRSSRPETAAGDARAPDDNGQPEHGHSMWWMVVCCAPMILLALAILLGVFGPR